MNQGSEADVEPKVRTKWQGNGVWSPYTKVWESGSVMFGSDIRYPCQSIPIYPRQLSLIFTLQLRIEREIEREVIL